MAKIIDKRKGQKGFSTLEMLLGMFLLMLALTAVVSVSFGNQSMIIDSQANAEALNIAQGLLEKAQADAREDFNLVNPYSTSSSDGFYDERVTVEPFTDQVTGQPDYFTKLVTAKVTWKGEFNRELDVTLSTLVTNFNYAVGGDTCNSVLGEKNLSTHKFEYKPETWHGPAIKNQYEMCSSGKCPMTDIDAYKEKLYVTIGDTDATSTPTFVVFDIDSKDRQISDLGSVDNDLSAVTGLNAVTVAEDPADPASQKIYAYVASASSVNQPLQVIDVTNPASMEVKDVTTLDISGKAHGNSIFYANGYVYLGLESTADNGPEFSIVDVHKPLAASEVGHWPKNGSLNSAINSIYVKGDYAYLTLADSDNMVVLNISDPTAPKKETVFNAAGNDNNGGKSAAIVGKSIYLGRTQPLTDNGDNLYILGASDLATSTLPILGSYAETRSVDSVIVRGKNEAGNSASYPALAFLLTPKYFKVLDISEIGSMGEWATVPFDGTGGSNDVAGSDDFEPSLDCEGNIFFTGSNTDDDRGYISVISP